MKIQNRNLSFEIPFIYHKQGIIIYHIECESSYPDGRITKGKNQGISQNQKNSTQAVKRGKQTVEEIAEDTSLSVEEVGQMAGLQTV